MVGAMCANFVSLDTAIILSGSGETAQTLQSALDSIFPKLLPLIVSLLALVGVRKGMNVAWIILIMVIGPNWAFFIHLTGFSYTFHNATPPHGNAEIHQTPPMDIPSPRKCQGFASYDPEPT